MNAIEGEVRPMSIMEGSMNRMEETIARSEMLNARLINIIFANAGEPVKDPEVLEQTLVDTIGNKIDRLQLVNDKTEYVCGVLSELLGSIKLREGC